MKKKYFILAFTFLFLLVGQSSLGQEFGNPDCIDCGYQDPHPPLDPVGDDLDPSDLEPHENPLPEAPGIPDDPWGDSGDDPWGDSGDDPWGDGGGDPWGDGGGDPWGDLGGNPWGDPDDGSGGDNGDSNPWGGDDDSNSGGGDPWGDDSDDYVVSSGNYDSGGNNYNPGTSVPNNINTVYSETTSNIIPYNFEEGKNNIFNANGRALRSGATGNLLQIEINGVLYKPSQLNRTDGTISALNKIATFYAQSKGYSGSVRTVNTIGKKQGVDVASYGNGVLTIRSIAFAAGKFDNVNDFKSVINHEVLHWKDPRNNAADYNFMDHANIYLKAASDPDFKNTSTGFKISQTNEYMIRMLNGVGMNSTRIIEEITRYNNENTGGIKISNPAYAGSLLGFSFDISIDGILQGNNFSFEVLDSPRE